MQIKIAKNTLLAAILIAIMSVFMLPNEAKAERDIDIVREYISESGYIVNWLLIHMEDGSVIKYTCWTPLDENGVPIDNQIRCKPGHIEIPVAGKPVNNENIFIVENAILISSDYSFTYDISTCDISQTVYPYIENEDYSNSTKSSIGNFTIQNGKIENFEIESQTQYALNFKNSAGINVSNVVLLPLHGRTIAVNPEIFTTRTSYSFPIVSVVVDCDGMAQVTTHNDIDSTLLEMIFATSAPSTSQWNKISSFTPYDKSDTTTYATGIGYVKAACYQKNVGCERIKLFCPDTNTRYNSYWDWLHGVQAANGGGGLLSPKPCASALDTILLAEKATVYPVPADRSEGITVAINAALVPYIQSGTISVVDYATNEVLHTFTLTNLAEMHIDGNYFSAAAGMQALKISLQLNDPCKGIITNNSYLTFILQ